MVGHVISRRHLAKRAEPAPLPTGLGITSSATTVDGSMGTTLPSLAYDSSVAPGAGSPSAPPLFSVTTPGSPTTSALPEKSSPSPQPSAESNASSPIPMSTVIGSCVGALIGAVALIVLGLWFYRRYSRYLKKYARSRGHLSIDRNAHGEWERSRSRQEPWSKLEDDKWEDMNKSKEADADAVAPMEKLTMFKKSPSVRTAYTHKSDEQPVDLPHPFSQYHATLAQGIASNETPPVPVPKPFLAHVDTGPELSWDSRLMSDGAFLTLRSPRLSGGAVSPTPNMAIPTPAATRAYTHHWESAEVVGFDERQSTDIVDGKNPFEHERSYKNNPFFNAQDFTPSRHSHSRSSSMTKSIHKSTKGKDRVLPEDPFRDSNVPSFFSPPFANHTPNDSLSSISSNDRAIQSLIAVLDISQEEVQERLRVASLQPSFISAVSISTDDEDVSKEFPLPPSDKSSQPEKY